MHIQACNKYLLLHKRLCFRIQCANLVACIAMYVSVTLWSLQGKTPLMFASGLASCLLGVVVIQLALTEVGINTRVPLDFLDCSRRVPVLGQDCVVSSSSSPSRKGARTAEPVTVSDKRFSFLSVVLLHHCTRRVHSLD